MDFDPIARSYGWLERLAFGNALQRCRVALIEHTRHARNILILGEGNGRFLEALHRINSTGDITVVDASAGMIRLARERIGPSSRVRFICNDVRAVDLADRAFDLVVTQFFLDCFTEWDVVRIVQRYSQRLLPAGLWLWADFAVPESGWRRGPMRLMIWMLYRFFRVATRLDGDALVDPSEIFERQGLEAITQRNLSGGMLRSVLWACRDRGELS